MRQHDEMKMILLQYFDLLQTSQNWSSLKRDLEAGNVAQELYPGRECLNFKGSLSANLRLLQSQHQASPLRISEIRVSMPIFRISLCSLLLVRRHSLFAAASAN